MKIFYEAPEKQELLFCQDKKFRFNYIKWVGSSEAEREAVNF